MFDGLITGVLARVIADSVKVEKLTEIRLRVGRRLLLMTTSKNEPRIYPRLAGGAYIVTKEDIDGIILRATNLSPYSVSDEMIKGYVPSKRLRIGVGGEGVSDRGRLINLKNVSYLTIRVPHQIYTAADAFLQEIYDKDTLAVKNTLIISPPSGGKTTALRELARIISANKNVVLIDERYELACVSNGVPSLDIGDAEVISGVPKTVAYENCIRAMNPDVLITDELFRDDEISAVCDIIRCGVNVIASVHGDSVAAIENSVYKKLTDVFDVAVVLEKHPVGSVKEILRL